MKTLDLHGVSWKDAPIMVEEFILLNEVPLSIISGNSPKMKSIVEEVLHRNHCSFQHPNDFNLGSYTVFKVWF